jgi:hypothetical protein
MNADPRLAILNAARHSGDWPAPDMSVLRESRRDPPPLPLDVFGPWAEWINASAEGAACPVDYVAASLLAGASALIGNARWCSPWPQWREPPVLWVALIGRPSSGKSPGQSAVTDPLRSLESELGLDFPERQRRWQTEAELAKARRSEWQQQVKDAAKARHPPPELSADAVEPSEPARPRLNVGDVTPEALGKLLAAHPKGLLFSRDELAGWLDGFGRYNNGGDRALWLEAFGGRAYTIDRVKTGGEPIRIAHLSVAILGGIQPDRLASALMAGDDDGLASRFILIWPDPVSPHRPRQVADDAAALAALRRLLQLAMIPNPEGRPEPGLVMLAEDAIATFEEWRRDHAASEGETSGLLASHWGKLPGILLRLALLLEHLWWSIRPAAPAPSSISAAAVAGAATLIEDYLKPMAERSYGDAALPQAERDAAVLAKWIKRERPAILNASKVRRTAKLQGLRQAEAFSAAVKVLVEADWLRPIHEPTGGRPKSDYSVNPLLWSAL